MLCAPTFRVGWVHLDVPVVSQVLQVLCFCVNCAKMMIMLTKSNNNNDKHVVAIAQLRSIARRSQRVICMRKVCVCVCERAPRERIAEVGFRRVCENKVVKRMTSK